MSGLFQGGKSQFGGQLSFGWNSEGSTHSDPYKSNSEGLQFGVNPTNGLKLPSNGYNGGPQGGYASQQMFGSHNQQTSQSGGPFKFGTNSWYPTQTECKSSVNQFGGTVGNMGATNPQPQNTLPPVPKKVLNGPGGTQQMYGFGSNGGVANNQTQPLWPPRVGINQMGNTGTAVKTPFGVSGESKPEGFHLSSHFRPNIFGANGCEGPTLPKYNISAQNPFQNMQTQVYPNQQFNSQVSFESVNPQEKSQELIQRFGNPESMDWEEFPNEWWIQNYNINPALGDRLKWDRSNSFPNLFNERTNPSYWTHH